MAEGIQFNVWVTGTSPPTRHALSPMRFRMDYSAAMRFTLPEETTGILTIR